MPRTSPYGTPPQPGPQQSQRRRDRRRRGAVGAPLAALLACCAAFAAAGGTPRAALAQDPDPGTQLNRAADPQQAAEEDAAAAAEAAKRRSDTIFGVVAVLVMTALAVAGGIYFRRLDKPAPVVDEPIYPVPPAGEERPSAVSGRPAVPAGSTMVLTEEQMAGGDAAARSASGPATAVLPTVAKPAPVSAPEPAAAPLASATPAAPSSPPPVAADPAPVIPVTPATASPAKASPAPPPAVAPSQPVPPFEPKPAEPTPAPPTPAAAPVFATAPAAPAAPAAGATPVGEDRPTLVKPRSGAAATPPAVLEFVGGPAAGRKQTLEGVREAVMGRANDADIVIPDAEVSRRHARLTRADDGAYALVDMASANGLYVNGERVFQATLRDGDRVRIGQSEMVFRSGEAAA